MSEATRMLTRRKLMIGLGVGATVALSELYVPRRSSARLTEASFTGLFPGQIGPWTYLTQSGLILPPDDQLSRTLYEQLLTRLYAVGNDIESAVMLLLAYSSIQEGRLQVHRPEVCYPAAGFTLVSNSAAPIRIDDSFAIPARFIVADRGARRECILYWTRVGPNLPTRWFDQRLMMAKANLQGYIPDGLLGRVSMVTSDTEHALATLSTFVRTLVGSVNRKGRTLLIGPN